MAGGPNIHRYALLPATLTSFRNCRSCKPGKGQQQPRMRSCCRILGKRFLKTLDIVVRAWAPGWSCNEWIRGAGIRAVEPFSLCHQELTRGYPGSPHKRLEPAPRILTGALPEAW